ncbi:DUF2087 domain-containing protein [candidate division KSB1 bacterium]|nr:DUF2087 domain-containing protein [candidate division KSB1 bacterium]
MNIEDNIDAISPSDLRNGFYKRTESEFCCVFCEQRFSQGVVYPAGDVLMDAETAVKNHVQSTHGNPFWLLVGLEQDNGLTGAQRELVPLLYQGLTDGDIAQKLGNAKSTIRNHRFFLREKYRETKILLAILDELYEHRDKPEDEFVTFHSSLPVRDDRAKVTKKEQQQILNKYFDGIRLRQFPKQQKRKLVLLKHIAEMFDRHEKYSEKQVNELLKKVQEDHVTLRRYLIEYGFMERKKDGSEYWLTD